MAKTKSDDVIFGEAKTKLGKAIGACKDEDVDSLVKLTNALTKMKAVELKMGEDDWGRGLTGDDK